MDIENILQWLNYISFQVLRNHFIFTEKIKQTMLVRLKWISVLNYLRFITLQFICKNISQLNEDGISTSI